MEQSSLAWRPPTSKEVLVGLALFVLSMLPALLNLAFGYESIINHIVSIFAIALLIIVFIVLILGIRNGLPPWAIPYLGVAVISVTILQISPGIWESFFPVVQRAIGYTTKSLQVRVLYQALRWGFFWLVAFMAAILVILLLMIWPRTRKLAQRIHRDWTLLSFMMYGGLVFVLELVFEEYAYDELWKIACRICLALGAWIYLKSADHRKRILALLAGVTLTFWIAAVGKWVVLPLQVWGDWYGYDHWTYRRFEFGSTIAQWGWVVLFMLIPSLLTLMPRPRQTDPMLKETLTSA
jgi:hypothetical protein